MRDNTYQTILSPDSAEDLDPLYSDISADESSEELLDIRRYAEDNNRLLTQIEQHTMVMTIIMVISVICSVISVVSALLMALS